MTSRQRETLGLIEQSIEQRQIAPSFDELKRGLGLRSKSGIHRILRGLEERGVIRRLPNRARAIEVVHNSGPAAPAVQAYREMLGEQLAAVVERKAVKHSIDVRTAIREAVRAYWEPI